MRVLTLTTLGNGHDAEDQGDTVGQAVIFSVSGHFKRCRYAFRAVSTVRHRAEIRLQPDDDWVSSSTISSRWRSVSRLERRYCSPYSADGTDGDALVALRVAALVRLQPAHSLPLSDLDRAAVQQVHPARRRPAQGTHEALLERCGFGSSGLFVMDGSKRSNHGNAYSRVSARRNASFSTPCSAVCNPSRLKPCLRMNSRALHASPRDQANRPALRHVARFSPALAS